MRIYTVHLRRHGLDPDRDLVLVKEGFCWPAGLFTVAWAVSHRMWRTALALLAIVILLNGLTYVLGADALTDSTLSLGTCVLFGLLANDLRRWALERRGFVFDAVVSAPDRDAAVRRYLDHSPRLVTEMVGMDL